MEALKGIDVSQHLRLVPTKDLLMESTKKNVLEKADGKSKQRIPYVKLKRMDLPFRKILVRGCKSTNDNGRESMEMQIEDNDNSMIIDDEIYQEEMEWDIWKSFEIEFIFDWFCTTMHLPILKHIICTDQFL